MKGDHAITGNERFVGYTIIRYLNHIEPSKSTKWEVWNKFLTTLSTVAIVIIKIKSCFDHLFCMFSFPCTVSATQSLVAPFKVLQKIGDKKFFLGLTKAGDWVIENLSWETIFLAITLLAVHAVNNYHWCLSSIICSKNVLLS